MTNLNPAGVPRINRTPTRRAAPKITPIHDAIFHTPARPVPNVAPKRSPVFGPVGNVARPIIHAQRQAHRVAQRAQQPVLRNIQVPYVPKLAHPTPSQHRAATNIVRQGLAGQGAGPSVGALSRGGGTRAQQVRINRFIGAERAEHRQQLARVGALSLPRPTYGPPTPQAPFSLVDPLVRSAIPTPRYLPSAQSGLISQGQAVSQNLMAQAKPGDQHTRFRLPGATIDLTGAEHSIGNALAGNPLSAFAKGMSELASTRPISDKTVLGRSLNDLLTYPAAAIPTAYQAATHPGKLASGIVSQVTHPVQTFEQHPLFGALLLHGGVSALGRGIGAVGRATGADFASTSRNMIGIAGESGVRLRTPRSYSKDVFRKAGQVVYDKRLQPIRDAKGDIVKDARGRPVMAAPTRSVFNRPDRLQTKRADFIVSRRNAMVREARAQAAREVGQAQPTRGGGKVATFFDRSLASQAGRLRVLPKGLYRPEKDVVAMAMQGTLRGAETFREDLVKERQRLEDVYQQSKREMDPLQKRSNRTQARTIDRVLNDPKALANAEGVFASARSLAAQSNELSRRAVEAHMLSPEASARAKLFPYAQSHMGATHGPTEDFRLAHEAVKATASEVRTLTNRVKQAKLDEQRHLGRTHDVIVAQRNRRILRQDDEVKAAIIARSRAQKELTLANRGLRNAQRQGAVTPRAHVRVSAARIALEKTKADHKAALVSFEGRVSTARGKLARGETLTGNERRIVNFDRQPGGRLHRLEAARAERITAEKELHGAKGRLTQATRRRAQTPEIALRDSQGHLLTNEQIHAHMRANGVDPEHIAYLPHRADVRGARAYYQQFKLGRPNLDQESRTGAAYEKGAIDTGFGLPLEHIVRASTTLTGAREFDRLIRETGIKHPSGRYFTWKEATEYAPYGGRAPNEATGRLLPGEPNLVPVRALPAKYEEARAKAIQTEQDPAPPGRADELVQAQTDRFRGPDPADPNAKNVVLIPETIAKRIQENIGATHSFDRSFQAFTSGFRRTVLPFSTKWLTGNIVEALGRLAVAGVSPHDPYVGRKLVGEMQRQDPHAAMQALSHLVGGLMYGERGLTNYRTGEDALGATGGMVAHSLPGRAGGKLIKAATEPQFFFNRWFERQAQYAALGKYARRQMQELSGSWFKALHAQDQALRDVAHGLKDTGAQQDAAKFLDETLGQYSRFSPKMRRLIQGYTPFLPWYLNSIRFVFHTLPVRHPIQLAILTQAEQAFQRDWQDQHRGIKGKAPDLMTAIPAKGGFVDVARYTPFGFPGPLATGEFSQIPGAILPQVSGASMAALGLDPFGRPLTAPKTAANPKGEVKGGAKALVALNQLAGGFVPGLSSIQRLREGGGTPYSTSNVFSPQVKPARPGVPQPSAAERMLNPFRPVYVTPDKTADPLLSKYGIKAGTSVDDLAKKYGIKKGTSVDDLATKYGIK